jgi:hypothetical protein
MLFCGGGHVGERKLWRQVLFSKSPFPEKMIVPGKSTFFVKKSNHNRKQRWR